MKVLGRCTWSTVLDPNPDAMNMVLIMTFYLTLLNQLITVFKTKAYKQFTPTVFIGDDALKFIKEAKYLGFTFNYSKCDDSDMLRQMGLLYAKPNKLLRTFSHCSSDGKVTLFQRSTSIHKNK